MGRKGFEYLLGFHAAPTFIGLTPGSLLSFQKSKFTDFDGLLSSYEQCFLCKGISVFCLAEGKDRVLILFYREKELEKALERRSSNEILSKCGYRRGSSLQEKLIYLKKRMRTMNSFPHEVGLFLGYPPEDVEGFIRNKGRSFSYSGYWKVYANEEETKRLFERYTMCTKEFCDKLDSGMPLSELLRAV